jgi:hypothetical protein
MFSKHLFARLSSLITLSFLLSFLWGCSLPEDEPCTAEEMVSPVDASPFDTVVDSLTPTFSWRYPDPSCHPDHYTLSIVNYDSTHPRFDLPADRLVHYVDVTTTSYTLPAEAGLQPGQTYFWYLGPRPAVGLPERTYGATYWFTTGPLCNESTILEPAALLYPPDGRQAYFPGTVNLDWENQMSCWPAGDFYLQIAKDADFTEMVWWGDVHNKESIWISSGPPMFQDCTRYYWRIRTDPAGGGEGPYSETWSFVLSWTNFICPLPLGISPILPDRHFPLATIIEDSACWSGPSLDYVIVDYLRPGQELEIQGRDQGGGWWYVDDPAIHKSCWLYGEHVEASGDLSQVPVQQAPPAPTRTPTIPPPASVNCGQYGDPKSCENNQACWWDSQVQPNGACKIK